MTDSPELTAAPAEDSRQARLLAAALRVLARAGLRGLTHRAVDREAGFPEGTCSVSYRTRAALLASLTQFVGATLTADVRELGLRLPTDHTDILTSLPGASELLERWATVDDGALLMAMLELSLESVRTPELVQPVGQWRTELVSIVESIVERNAPDDSRLRAETAVASIEGIVLSALALPSEIRGAYIRDTLRMVLVGTAQRTH